MHFDARGGEEGENDNSNPLVGASVPINVASSSSSSYTWPHSRSSFSSYPPPLVPQSDYGNYYHTTISSLFLFSWTETVSRIQKFKTRLIRWTELIPLWVDGFKFYFHTDRQCFLNDPPPPPLVHPHAFILMLFPWIYIYSHQSNLSECYWTCLNLLITGSCISSPTIIITTTFQQPIQHPVAMTGEETLLYECNTATGINSYSRCNLWLCRFVPLSERRDGPSYNSPHNHHQQQQHPRHQEG